MKTLKVLLQEVVSGIKAWVNSNFAQESNTVHKTGNETVNGVKTFSEGKIVLGATSLARETKGSTTYEMTASDFGSKFGFFKITQFKADSTSAPRGNNGDYDLIGMSPNTAYGTFLCTTPRNDLLWYGKFWESVWQGWKEVVNCESNQTITGEKTFQRYVSVYSNTLTRGTIPSENAYCTFGFKDSGGTTTARLLRWVNSDGYNGLTIECWDAQVTTDKSIYFQLAYDTQGNGYSKLGGTNVVGFIPGTDNSYSFGTSTNRWATINGINPGAMSFPNYSDTTYIDISGSIVPPTGETSINKNLGDNQYTPPVDGWLSIRIDGAQYLQIYRNAYNCPGVTSGDGTTSIKLVVTLPVRKNETYTIRIKKDSAGTEYYQLYPCLGNV